MGDIAKFLLRGDGSSQLRLDINSCSACSKALPALKGRRDLAETIFTSLNNHVIGAIRDETGREMAANIFGKEWQQDRSYSDGTNNSTSVRRELHHIFHTAIFKGPGGHLALLDLSPARVCLSHFLYT